MEALDAVYCCEMQEVIMPVCLHQHATVFGLLANLLKSAWPWSMQTYLGLSCMEASIKVYLSKVKIYLLFH